MSGAIVKELPEAKTPFDWKRMVFLLAGLALFLLSTTARPGRTRLILGECYCILTKQAKGALAVFVVAATWWIFEVVPIGVTSLLIGSL